MFFQPTVRIPRSHNVIQTRSLKKWLYYCNMWFWWLSESFHTFTKHLFSQQVNRSIIWVFFQSTISKVWFLTAPPLDRHSPDPATPRSADRGRWCSWESSPLQWRHVWKIGRSHKQTSWESSHQAPHRAPDWQTQWYLVLYLDTFFPLLIIWL